MELRLTLLAEPTTASAGPVDLALRVPPGTCLDDVHEEICDVALDDARLSPDGWYVAEQRLSRSARLGDPPLLEGAVLSREPTSTPAPGILLHLDVLGGPDAGATYHLTPGEHVVGRGAGCEVRIADPLMSRRHVVISVRPEGLVVRETGSANGSTVAGLRVPSTGCPLPVGAHLVIGSSALVASRDSVEPGSCRPGGDGRLLHNRPPRPLLPPTVGETVQVPHAPSEQRSGRPPWAALAAPLFTAAVLLAGGVRGTMLLFVAVSPLVAVVAVVGGMLPRALRRRRERARWAQECASASVRLREALEREHKARQCAAPDLAHISRVALSRATGLYERGPGDDDFLAVRWGLGRAAAHTHLAGGTPETHIAVTAGTPLEIADAPLTSSLAQQGVVGCAGPRDRVLALARAIIVQVAALHGPRDVEIIVLAPSATSSVWTWTRWLPHLRRDLTTVADLAGLVDGRLESGPRAEQIRPHVMVVLDQARGLRDQPGLERVLAHGPGVGVLALCLEDDPADLPPECRSTALIDGPAGTLVEIASSAGCARGVTDGLTAARAEQVARALAPVVQLVGGEGGRLPERVVLLDLLPTGAVNPSTLASSWRRGSGRPRAVVGSTRTGPLCIDLHVDGPHALVAGTTGSGKSEFLRTLVASLALTCSPDDLTFLLVDYKGGSAFGECADLPHVAGMVTDLDPAESRRALASLTAELRRRERALAQCGARDLDDLRASHPDDPALPRLVIVVDEFATLVDELPDFVPGLVGLAQRGRSLGIHLVLATQRPSGVVSADIRANASLRIALRLSADEAREVVGSPSAAAIPATTPGRAVIRTASGLHEVQLAHVGGPGPARGRVEVLGKANLDAPVGRTGSLDVVVAATQAAAELLGVPAAIRPWLSPLPSVVAHSRLPAPGGRPGGAVEPPHEARSVAFALADEPGLQRRATVTLDLSGGDHLAVVGGPRSGRTTTLRTLIGAAVEAMSPEHLHLHALDAGGGLAFLSRLPHTGSVIPVTDAVRADRLMQRLIEDIATRRAAGSEAAGSGAAGGADATALIVDGWESWAAAWEAVEHGRGIEAMLTVLRDGPAVGVTALVTGGRGLLSGRLASAMPRRLLLSLPDRADVALAGLRPADLPSRMPPGRALLDDGREVQVAVIGGVPESQAEIDEVVRWADRWPPQVTGPRPLRLLPLPRSVDLAALGPSLAGARTVVLGVGGDGAQPQHLDISADGVVIAGPARSGRSTALRVVARGLVAAGRSVAVVAPRGGPVTADPGIVVLGHDCASVPPGIDVVLVDDVEMVQSVATQEWLRQLVVARGESGAPVVVLAGDTDAMLTSFSGPVAALRRRRPDGILLAPRSPSDGEVLGVRAPRGLPPGPPGRGLLVRNGGCVPVQVAAPPRPPGSLRTEQEDPTTQGAAA